MCLAYRCMCFAGKVKTMDSWTDSLRVYLASGDCELNSNLI